MRASVVAVVLLLPLVVAGCSSVVPGHAVAGAGRGTQSATPATKTPRPADRDPQAVAAALRQLDPCKVFDLSVAAKRHKKVTTHPLGPHACELLPDDGAAVEGIRLTVEPNDQLNRYSATPLELAGARAYRLADKPACIFDVPVSHVLALEFTYTAEGDPCGPLQQYVQGSLAKLRNPDALRWTGAPPIGGWDGCALVAAVLGQSADAVNYSPFGSSDPFSGCSTTPRHDEDTGTQPPGMALSIGYDDPPSTGGQSRQIAGKTVWLDQQGPNCSADWAAGPASGTGGEQLVFGLLTDRGGCDQAAVYAQEVMAALHRKPPSVSPQRPLLYAAGDNDTGAVGACADLSVSGGQADCEPYQPVQPPQGAAAVLDASGGDPNMTCAVSGDAVHAAFGAGFKAVTWGQHCFWVDGTHVVQLIVDISPGDRPEGYGQDQELWVDRTETAIAGRPAVTFWTTGRGEYDIYLAPQGQLQDSGIVHIEVQARGGRGHTVDPATLRVDESYTTKARNAMAAIVQRYFPA